MATVLIVDDSVAMAEMLGLVVETFGDRPVLAYSGPQALEMFERHRPDIVLLDLMMPDMDGFEVLEQLDERPGGRKVPVIVVTARADQDLERLVAEAGAEGLLHKPVDTRELLVRIGEILSDKGANPRAALSEADKG